MNNALNIGNKRIYILASSVGRCPFHRLKVTDLVREEKAITTHSARSMAYIDAYALAFYVSGGKPLPAVGDLRVTRTLIACNILAYCKSTNTISPGTGMPQLQETGPLREERGKTYQAVLE